MNSNKIERKIISLANYIIFILLCALFSASVNAAPLSPADRDTIQQQQQQLLLQNQQQREELERSIPRPAPARPMPVTGSGPCFTIDIITLSGATLPAKATEKQWQDYLAKLRDTQAYKNVMVTYGTGSDMQRGIQAATAALQGLAGGNIGGALAGASAPELAYIIGHRAGINDDTAEKAIAHAILGGVTAALQGNSAAAGAVGAASGELIATAIARQFYPDTDPSKLTEEQKQTVSTLASVSAGIAGGIAGGNTAGAAAGASAGKNSVENNFLGATSSDKLDKAIEKIKQGDRSLAAANDVIKLENADKRSDALMDKFRRDPSSLSESERTELSTYVRVYAAEMQNIYGADRAKEMVQNLFAYPGYERNPDNGVLNQAQSIVNTWGYHESNASIGDAPLMFGSSVLGITIREGMAVNAAIGTAVNTGFQLSGNELFSYVDAIMAGVASAATTGKGWKVSAAINMGGLQLAVRLKGKTRLTL